MKNLKEVLVRTLLLVVVLMLGGCRWRRVEIPAKGLVVLAADGQCFKIVLRSNGYFLEPLPKGCCKYIVDKAHKEKM